MHILALDQGTTSSRAILFDLQGKVLSSAQQEFKQSFPKPGYVEHDGEEIWSSTYSVAKKAIEEGRVSPKDIAAIGISNQRETTLIWDRSTSKLICPAIVWQDRRTTEICENLKAKKLEPLFNQKTGLLLDPYFSATKIRWILDHIEGAQEKAARGELAFGTVDSFLVWRLTKGALHITDVSNASRTLLFNIHTLKWDEELLDLLNIPESILPEVRSNSEVYGSTASGIFSGPIPIGALAGDQQAALFGQNCLKKGEAKATYGTGCFLLMNTGEKPVESKQKLLTTIAWQIDGKTSYALEGTVFIAGAAVQWLRDNLKIIKESKEIDELASSVKDTDGLYFVPSFTGLGAPHWAPHARGAIFGLTRGTTAAHIALSILEAIAFSTEEVLLAMEEDAKIKVDELHVDGGMVASDILMQIQANFSQIPILRSQNRELSALGVAKLAALAVKTEITPEEKVTEPFNPNLERSEREKMFKLWAKAVELTQKWRSQ